MSFYDDPDQVQSYIKMCEGYDGTNLYKALTEHLPNQSRLLELGSGPGLDIAYLKQRYSVTGSDLSDEFLKICRKQHSDVSFIKLNVLDMAPVSDLQFDCIYSNKVLHHLTPEQLSESLAQQAKALSDGGIIAHSFWMGEKSEEMQGMLFTYYQEQVLDNLIAEHYEFLTKLRYEEFKSNDSAFIIARLKN